MAHRNSRGNMLAMVASAAILLIVVMMFGLQYLSVNRGHMEQRTAAEAAALVVANDIGRIVISTPECGFVALCDQPPIGTTTQAEDDYFCEVRSVNELMATARLNYIVGDLLNDNFMKQMAIQDRDNILKAKDKLIAEVKKSMKAGSFALDAHGNKVTPYEDAEAIYIKNNAKVSNYIPPTLELDLGYLEGGIATSVQIPNPESKGNVGSGQKMNGCYVSDTNVVYGGQNFVFASTGRAVALGDLSKYRSTVSGLPFDIPAVVKVEADQKFSDQGKEYIQHFTACATPGNDFQHPVGGAITLSFPDGPMPEISKFKDLYQWSEMQKAKCDVLSADGGDFPVDAEASISAPPWPQPAWSQIPPRAADLARLAIYDWIRAAGSRVNLDSLLSMQDAKLDDPSPQHTTWKAIDPLSLGQITLGDVPTGIMHIFTFNSNGSILYRSKTIKPYPYTVIAHKQLYAELQSGQSLKSKAEDWKLAGITLGKQSKSMTPHPNLICMNSVASTQGDSYEIGGDGGSSHGGKGGGGDHEGGKGSSSYEEMVAVIESTDQFDFYMRDMVRQRGQDLGGFHQGEPMDYPFITWHKNTNINSFEQEIGGGSGPSSDSGKGAPPIISKLDDFATDSVPSPPYRGYSYGPSKGAPRPTYIQNGVAVDLRFRRQIKVGALGALIGADLGYIGEML